MRLEDFPRPKNDNGRGLHWSPTPYHPSGSVLDYWIDELLAMNIKWLKVLDDGGGSSVAFCRRLIDADIMPIVRIYRPRPNPGALGGRERDAVRMLVDVGVRYIETNNEPDIPAEWQGPMPRNWFEIVINNFIKDADFVLSVGGLPAVPAMAVGSKADPIKAVVERGRKDIFERGAWYAIHNYTLNHPLDYPEDEVNQTGKPVTPEEYQEHYPWGWNEPIERINQWREEGKNPGATVADDPFCFRAYELAGQMVLQNLGFYIPVISTEGGPVTGWRDDRRYPRVSPWMCAEWVERINHFLQTEAPEWYFTLCHWLIADRAIEPGRPFAWESQCWYTHWWDQEFGFNGVTPVVDRVKAMPSISRLRPAGTATIVGIVQDEVGDPLVGIPVVLQQEGRDVDRQQSDLQGRFRFERLSPGTYTFLAAGREVGDAIALQGGETREVTLVLSGGAQSRLTGVVVNTQGTPQPDITVSLYRGEERVAVATTDAEGRFAFEGLSRGTYRLEAENVAQSGIVLDGWNEQEVTITVTSPTYVYRVVTRRLLSPEETGNRRKFYGYVLGPDGTGINGIALEMRWVGAEPGTQFPRTRTGADPFKPQGYYEFLHTPGEFQIEVVEGDWPSEVAEGLKTVDIPGREGQLITWEVSFQLQPEQEGVGSRVAGRVPGGRPGQMVRLINQEGRVWETEVDEEEQFAFQDLPAGTYRLELVDIAVMAEDIVLDGRNTFEITFPVRGVIQGLVKGGTPDMTATLVAETHNWTRMVALSPQGQYRFTNLPPGTYHVEVMERVVGPVTITGEETETLPALDLRPARRASIQGRVVDAEGDPLPDVRVRLLQDGQVVGETRSAENGSYAFQGLEAGTYELVVEGLAEPIRDLRLQQDQVLTMDVTVPPAPVLPEKVMPVYLLFPPPDHPLTRANLLAVIPYLQGSGATLGFDPEEARRARQVIIVGGEEIYSREVAESLQEAGCEVERASEDTYALVDYFQALGAAPE